MALYGQTLVNCRSNAYSSETARIKSGCNLIEKFFEIGNYPSLQPLVTIKNRENENEKIFNRKNQLMILLIEFKWS